MQGRPNTLSEDQFLAVYGGIYEHSAWVAQAVWDAGTLPTPPTRCTRRCRRRSTRHHANAGWR